MRTCQAYGRTTAQAWKIPLSISDIAAAVPKLIYFRVAMHRKVKSDAVHAALIEQCLHTALVGELAALEIAHPQRKVMYAATYAGSPPLRRYADGKNPEPA
jgi:hypothetical protein